MATRRANRSGNLRPSSFRAYVEVNGDVEAMESIRAIGYRASHTTPLMGKLVELLQFQQARRVRSKPWPALKASTVARKAREGENTEILRDESRKIRGKPTRAPDHLYNAIVIPNFPGQVRRVTRASASFGVDSKGKGKLFYARFVQNTRGTKRRILAIDQKDAMTILIEIERWLVSGRKVTQTATGKLRYDQSGRP